MKSNEVLVKFGPGIPGAAQAKAMFEMELLLQRMGHDVRVEKETMADDSMLRQRMTQTQRDKL